MKILIVARAWGYEGGVEQYFINFVNALSQFGHKSVIMYARKTANPPEEHIPISAEYLIPSLEEFPNSDNIKDCEKVLKIIEDENVDVVYTAEIKNYVVLRAMIARKPTIARLHGSVTTCIRHGVKTFYLSRRICKHKLGLWCYLHGCFLSKQIGGGVSRFSCVIEGKRRLEAFHQVKKILVTCHYQKNEFLNNGFKDQQIIILPHSPSEIPKIQERNMSYDDNTVLFAGRIDRYKGVDVLLKALTFVQHDFNAWIFGVGPYLEKCKHLCKKLNLQDKVKFLGWVPNDKLRDFYLKATLVAVPSIWPEPFTTVGIEAMASARPIVAFDVGGNSELVEHGETAFLVRRMDYRDMADKITLLLANKSLARKMGLNGRKRCLAKFNRISYIERLIEIFQSVVENEKNKHEVNYIKRHE